MAYATVNLRGKDREIKYRVKSIGPGSGWETEWQFVMLDDADACHDITEAEEEAINKAMVLAEGRTY
jgi:hypothetical protein